MRKLLRLACWVVLAWGVSVFVSVAAASPGPCRLIDPSTCPNGAELTRANGFVQALAHFTGKVKASYFGSDRTLSSQALAALGGPPESVLPLADKRYLFSACASRDCTGSAAAVIVNEYGQIEGLGFSSFHCETGCEDYRHLDIYVRKDAQDEAVLAALKTWGTSEKIRKALSRPEADDGLDKRTDVHLLP